MPTVPIDRRDFLRRAALIGTALPVAGLARQARESRPRWSRAGSFSTIPIAPMCG